MTEPKLMLEKASDNSCYHILNIITIKRWEDNKTHEIVPATLSKSCDIMVGFPFASDGTLLKVATKKMEFIKLENRTKDLGGEGT